MPSLKLTSAFVDRVKPPATGDRCIHWSTEPKGFGLMITSAGHKSFVLQYRFRRRSVRMKLDGRFLGHEAARGKENGGKIEPPRAGEPPFAVAQREARAVLGAIAQGRDPLAELRKAAAADADTLRSVFEEYFKVELGVRRDAEGRLVFPDNGSKLRSARKRVRIVERLIYPKLGGSPIGDIKRSDLIRMLDKIAEENGEVMADHVLAIVRKLMNWHASRSDEFRSPIVPGMARTKPKERVRKRILSDDELRAVWRAAEAHGGPWGLLLRFLLLTACRRDEARNMSRAEVNGETWVIPAARYKTKIDVPLPLSGAAQGVLATVPQIGSSDLVFTNDGRRPLGNFAKLKRRLDEACGVTGWTLHDLRRTARSLMSRAGVPRDHAEHCLGHIPGGVVDVYDQHQYFAEKKLAFEKLATLIEGIVRPRENVLPMRGKSQRT